MPSRIHNVLPFDSIPRACADEMHVEGRPETAVESTPLHPRPEKCTWPRAGRTPSAPPGMRPARAPGNYFRIAEPIGAFLDLGPRVAIGYRARKEAHGLNQIQPPYTHRAVHPTA